MLEQGGIYCKRCGRRVPKPPKEKGEQRLRQKKKTSPLHQIDVSKPNPSNRSNGIWHESPVRKPPQNQKPESPPKQISKSRIEQQPVRSSPPVQYSPPHLHNKRNENIEPVKKQKSIPPMSHPEKVLVKEIQVKQPISIPPQAQVPVKHIKRPPPHVVASKKSEIDIPLPIDNQQNQLFSPQFPSHKNEMVVSDGCGYLENFYKLNPKSKPNPPPSYPLEILSSVPHESLSQPDGYLLSHGKLKNTSNDLGRAEKKCSLPLINSKSVCDEEEGKSGPSHLHRVNHRLESTRSAPPRIKESEGVKEKLQLPPPVRRSHDYESSNSTSKIQKSSKLPSLLGERKPSLAPASSAVPPTLKPTQTKKNKRQL
jgi:hypothetical protein